MKFIEKRINCGVVRLCLPAVLFCLPMMPARAATVIQMTTNVLVSDVRPLGVNMGDNYWESPLLKVRQSFNFEGLRCRQAHNGMIFTNGFLSFNVRLNWQDSWFSNVYLGAKFRILSEPGRGTEGVITGITERAVDIWQNGNITTQAFFLFKQPLTNAIPAAGLRNNGILIDGTNLLDKGYAGLTNYYWNTRCDIVLNDTPPGSFGNAACRMPSNSTLRFQAVSGGANVSGTVFKVSFYVKKYAGTPNLRLIAAGRTNTVAVPNSWEYREYILTNQAVTVSAYLQQTDGNSAVLVDDILFEQVEANPSSFRSDAIEVLRDELGIGVMRFVQMGGWSIEDQLRPWNRMNNYKSEIGSKADVYEEYGYSSKIDINIPDMLSAAEEIGCVPWICISGTIYPSEMNALIEFLAGPTNTPWGAFRAQAYNHPQPYIDTLEEILIEFGNEAWNLAGPYAAKGYNGPDYWRDCIATAKSNPYYNSRIKIMTAGQNFSSSMANSILSSATNSDLYAIAPYVIHSIDQAHFASLDPTLEFATPEAKKELFRWFISYPLYHVYISGMPAQYAVSADKGVEYAFYEYNHHCTSGNASYAKRREFTFSIAHGISMANYALANLKEYGIRNQCFFTLMSRNSFEAGLWGCVLNMRRDQLQRRPVAYANTLMNTVRRGDLVQTVHTGDRPEFEVYGYFGSGYRTNRHDEIYSYAFRNSGTNGLILINCGLDNTQQVQLLLRDYVQGNTAQCRELSASSFTNANEWATTNEVVGTNYVDLVPEPVQPVQYAVPGFSSGYTFNMKPCSLYVFQWVSAGDYPVLDVSTSAVNVAEGGSATFGVRLSSNPLGGPVTVSVARVSGDADLSVQSGSSLVFTSANWTNRQTVTLAAAEDADTDLGSAVFRCAATGMEPFDVTATEAENDLGIIVSTNAAGVPENSTAQFDIRLSKNPAVSVTVTVARTSGDTNITVQSGATLIFNSGNWPDWQTVTLAAADDPDVGNGTAVIQCSAPGLTAKTVTASELDDDTVALVVSPRFLKVPEGGTAKFTVKMAAIPPDHSTVQVARVSGDSDLSVSAGAFLVFHSTNWNTPQTVTVSAATDTDIRNGDATIRCTPLFPNTTGPKDVAASETDSGLSVVSFQRGTNGYSGPSDSYLSSYSKDSNYGATGSGYLETTRTPVMAWNLASLGSTAMVHSAEVTFTSAKTDGGSSNSFDLTVYRLKRLWTEAGVTWNTTDGITPWQTPGAKGSDDRGELIAGVRIPESPDSLEKVIVTLNDAGLAYLQECILHPEVNFGFIFSNEENTGRRSFTLSENSTVSNRPKLTVYYAAPAAYYPVASASTVWVPEGGTASFNVTLSSPPSSAAVTVGVARVSGDTDIAVGAGSSLVFTPGNWNVPQTVTLTAGSDEDSTSGSAAIRCYLVGAQYAQVLAVEADSGEPDMDGDGIPNWWEEQYFGGPTNANAAAMAANGINTVLECYIAGLDPADPDSVFAISGLWFNSSNPVIVWPSVASRRYSVYWSSNLLSGFQAIQSNVPWTGNVFTDTAHGVEGQGFYRIEVQLQP